MTSELMPSRSANQTAPATNSSAHFHSIASPQTNNMTAKTMFICSPNLYLATGFTDGFAFSKQ